MSRELWDLSVDETERVAGVLEDSLVLCTEWGVPLDGDCDIEGEGDVDGVDLKEGGVEGGAFGVVGLSSGFEVPLFGSEFFSVVADLVEKFRKRDVDSVAWFDVSPGVRHAFPIYGDGDVGVEGFILSSVDDVAGRRVLPVVVPADVVEFSVSLFGPAANRARFLCELAGIYGDAVRLLGEGDGFRGSLVASLRIVVGVFRVEFGEYCDKHADDAGGGADACQ